MTRRLRLAPLGLLALALVASPGRADDLSTHLRVHGLLDLDVHGDAPGVLTNSYGPYETAIDPYRLRLFFDASVSPQLQVFVQTLHTDAYALRNDGAYALFTPWPERDLHVMAGKIPWPVGTWAPRTYSDHNPLIGQPLMYQYRTSLRWDSVAPSVDALWSAAGQGYEGPNYGAGGGMPGMPIVDDLGWDFGVVANGSLRPFEFAFGETQSAPSWAAPGPDPNRGQSLLGRLGISPVPDLRLGVSGSQGPYLPQFLASFALPAGKDERDYLQRLVMTDLEIQRGHIELRAEGALNRWETPYVGTLELRSGYAEAKYNFPFGAWFALRADALRFGDVTGSTRTGSWDDNVDRYETGVGYRVSRGVLAKAVWQHDRVYMPTGSQISDFWATQLSVAF